jgi:hypothetical protein
MDRWYEALLEGAATRLNVDLSQVEEVLNDPPDDLKLKLLEESWKTPLAVSMASYEQLLARGLKAAHAGLLSRAFSGV